MAEETPRTIFVSALEPSGDRHAASLVREALKLRPDLRFAGFGGRELSAAGCEVYRDLTAHASMVLGFAGHLRAYLAALRLADRLLENERPAAVLLVDSPGFNFLVARLARKHGVPVVYYICPQIWAWAPWRRAKILALSDLLISILPFEPAFYEGGGRPVRYVGHPLADALAALPADCGEELRRRLGMAPEKLLIGFFPGSRVREVEGLLQVFATVFREAGADATRHELVISCYRHEFERWVEPAARAAGVRATAVHGPAHAAMAACDLALVASGTATLELTWFRKPMLVFYRTNPIGLRLFQALSVTPWIALPNILAAGEEGPQPLVPEYLFAGKPPVDATSTLAGFLESGPLRREISARLARLRDKFLRPGAGRRAAEALLEFLEKDSGGRSGARPRKYP